MIRSANKCAYSYIVSRLVVRHGHLRAIDQWYEFESKAQEEALRAWCGLHSIEIDG